MKKPIHKRVVGENMYIPKHFKVEDEDKIYIIPWQIW